MGDVMKEYRFNINVELWFSVDAADDDGAVKVAQAIMGRPFIDWKPVNLGGRNAVIYATQRVQASDISSASERGKHHETQNTQTKRSDVG